MFIHPEIKFHFTESNKGLNALFSEEISIIKDFDAPRMNSFCTGRYCAHKCLEEFGIHLFPILKKENGSPQWPEGFTGSISHSKRYAGAIVARKKNYQSIGLDIEEINRIQPDLWHLLFTSKEQLFLSKYLKEEQQVLATIFFSAKEAFYKLRSEFTDDFIDFLDVEVIQENNTYFIRPLKNTDKFLNDKEALVVHVSILKMHVLSYITL